MAMGPHCAGVSQEGGGVLHTGRTRQPMQSMSGCSSNAPLISRTRVDTGTPSSSRNAISEERAILTPVLRA